MADPVDLKPIEHLYLENLLGVDEKTGEPIDTTAIEVVGHGLVAKLFEGTDTFLTPDGKLERMVEGENGKKEKTQTSLSKEVAWLMAVRNADGLVKDGTGAIKVDEKKKDGKLDLAEVKLMLESSFSKDEAAKIDAEAMLKGIDNTIKTRWAIVAANMQKFDGDLNWKPTLDALDTYNEGIHMDDTRHANSVINYSGLTKTGTNIVGFIPGMFVSAGKWDSKYMLLGDRWAEKNSESRNADRKAALTALRGVIDDGIKKQEKWALDANMDEALNKLSADQRELLTDNIPAKQLHTILTIVDPKKRADELYKFANGERPGFMGIGGGNTSGFSSADPFNYFGQHRNIYFARAVLAFLNNKSQTDDAQFDQNMQLQAVTTRKDMLGDGGSFTNLVAVGVSAPICGGSYLLSIGDRLWDSCERTKFRSWGDEARMDMIGRAVDFGLVMYSSYKGFQFLKEAWSLRRLAGLRGTEEIPGVTRVWSKNFSLRPKWMGGKGFKPLPIEDMKAARMDLAAKAAEGGKERAPGFFGNAWKGFKDKVFGPEDAKFRKMAGTVGHGGGKFIAGLTDYVILPLAVADPVDQAFQAYFNPFETNHELELAPYPDILNKPDPSVSSQPKK